ncbi:MAG TPA: phosphotransferase [Herpetosiphonaceae bacterium]
MDLNPAMIEAYLSRWQDGAVQIEGISELGGGTSGAAALKAFGYGRPLRIDYRLSPSTADARSGQPQQVVLRQVSRNGFGRERASDCVAEVWLDFNAFNRLDRHVQAQDIVGLTRDGRLESLGHVESMLLLTAYVPGQPYADDLLRIRDAGVSTELDRERALALADYLAAIHAVPHDDPLLWRRRLRDLVGHGEGIMGLTDSYPRDFPLATADDLRAIEDAANRWRWKLKPLTHRLCQVHGDFHPFNVLFTERTGFTVIDRSRGAWGEPADDLSCMTINYLFFGLQRYGRLAGPFEALYRAFWTRYLERRQDAELCAVIQPWFAWRALVLASPQWYSTLSDETRRALLSFARNVMRQEHFAWQEINSYLSA